MTEQAVEFTATCPCCQRSCTWLATQHGSYPHIVSRISRIDHHQETR